MESIAAKAFESFTVGGASVGLISAALISLMCVLVVYSWLVRADPFGALRGLVNHRRQRLETIRTRPWLSKEATDLADLELRQISLCQLTGIFDYRLQEPAVKLITHFRLRACYLRPVIDCFDGKVGSWSIGTSPDAKLVNTMLDDAIDTLSKNEKLMIHSDRGSHYRWPGWLERINASGLIRSMSRKGCSSDNAACEGFFGRLKNEMYYGRNWAGITLKDFMCFLDRYIRWYNEKRIKISLGAMSPVKYRQHSGITT